VVLEDVIAVLERMLADEGLAGPVNVVAPDAVTNGVFTRALGRVLGRPALLPVPAPALRALFGEMADGALLASAHVSPGRLQAVGHTFRFPGVEDALRHLLGRAGAAAGGEGHMSP
jgi:NAD dependent epimerase/dehydratase family enzyme